MTRTGQEIKDILYGYIKAESISNTDQEIQAKEYFLDYFSKLDYFRKHPDYYGAFDIEDDIYNRSAVWAMVKGQGNDAVVLIHHNDVVTVEDFKLLKKYAFSPDELEPELIKIKDQLADEARVDLESGGYLFGRGGCDMKGGGSIQMALLTKYSQMEDFKGNVIVLGVPDEENLSAGMRAGVVLLSQLKEKYGLKYKLMINSEPHQRKNPEKGVFSFGSIGKIMPYAYIRGSLSHAGKVFEGLNPTNIMSEIVRQTEVNMEMSDIVGKEAAPPPTWLYLRENKISYDVSMPLTINGCLSVLTLNQSPMTVMNKFKDICFKSFETVIDDMNRNYKRFTEATGQPDIKLPWKPKVVEFGELYEEAEAEHGDEFVTAYNQKMKDIVIDMHEGRDTLITSNFKLVDFVYDYIDDLSPRVVVGLMPPYYPNVSDVLHEGYDDFADALFKKLNEFTIENYNQEYVREDFYTGISDLSYSAMFNGKEVEKSLKGAMPFYGSIYKLPIDALESISMPCINIGPWGKDFHKLTERVLKEDLFERTPEILDYAIKEILK